MPETLPVLSKSMMSSYMFFCFRAAQVMYSTVAWGANFDDGIGNSSI